MMKRFMTIAGLALIALATAPSEARALDEVSTSMTASCFAPDNCSVVVFTLTLKDNTSLQSVKFASSDTGKWTFVNLLQLYVGGELMAPGAVSTLPQNCVAGECKFLEINPGTLPLLNTGGFASPLTFVVAMGGSSASGNVEADLFAGLLQYSGDWVEPADCSDEACLDNSFRGTVNFQQDIIPEPVSSVLFMTGLAGVAALKRRRAKLDA